MISNLFLKAKKMNPKEIIIIKDKLTKEEYELLKEVAENEQTRKKVG